MRSLIFAAGIAATAIPLGAAQSAVLTLGGPLSRLCYNRRLARTDAPARSKAAVARSRKRG